MSDLDNVIFEPDDRFNMCGTHLVAASAGTGKTYSIQSLYLRLIVLRRLTVQQILVVTFTEAAMKELRERLRNVLLDALRYLEHPEHCGHEERIRRLVDLIAEDRRNEATRAVLTALLDFDLAAIYTIHGFCLRALGRFAFETGQSFNTEPISDSTAEIDRLCEDWWRRNISPADRETILAVRDGELNLDALKTLVRKYIGKPDAVLKPVPFRLQDFEEFVKKRIERVREEEVKSPFVEGVGSDKALESVKAIVQAANQCHTQANADQWLAAARTLLSVRTRKAKGPWRLPEPILEVITACGAVCKAAPNKAKADKFSLTTNEQFEYNSQPVPALIAPLAKLRVATIDAQDAVTCLLTTSDPKHPLRESDDSDSAQDGLRTIVGFAVNTPHGLIGPELYKAIKAVNKLGARLTGDVDHILIDMAPLHGEAANQIQAALIGLLSGAAVEIKAEYDRSRPARDTLSFDDYLINLRSALQDERQGPALLTALRGEYRAALIDEFQDTDPVQYAIFETIFRNDSNAPCFLVGDPKQAIYRFRNGDIETYSDATRCIASDNHHQLNRNFRSEENLVRAVNQLFEDRCRGDDGSPWTFRHDWMVYDGTLEAQGKVTEESLTVDGVIDPRPFKLWYFGDGQDAISLPGLGKPQTRRIWEQTAAGICHLLNDETTLIGGERVRPRDIAVLVMTHSEADAVEEELNLRNIPVVRQGTRNVFDTLEAYEFWTVLAALAVPRDAWRVRAAMATCLLGIPHQDIRALNGGARLPLPAGWPDRSLVFGADTGQGCGLENWIAFFEALHTTWYKSGLAAAISDLMRRSGLRARLAAGRHGERILTNVLHLAEIAHRAEVTERLSSEGLLAWMRRQLEAGSRDGDEEHELRLETDDDAVKIMTIFKSKGLQFPIVFVPSLWRRKAKSDKPLEYHEERDGRRRLVIETGTEQGRRQAIDECFEENIRLAYVALTRAIHRTVLVWGNFRTGRDPNALAWLFGNGNPEPALRGRIQGEPAIAVESLRWDTRAETTPYSRTDAAPANLMCLETPAVDKTHGHGSFSSLAPAAHAVAGVTKDRDEAPETEPQPDAAPEVTDPLFTFPAGKKTGTCWHAIFELLPFNAEPEQIRTTVVDQLETFGLIGRVEENVRNERVDATVRMVTNVLRNPLPSLVPGDADFALHTVGQTDRRNEWEFSFPSAHQRGGPVLRTPAFRDVLEENWQGDAKRRIFLDRLRSWSRDIPGGYLTGFLDLLFRQNGRYYILDWKSNRRNGRAIDFDADGLREEMAEHAYFLQYLFYSVAVHQYLRRALPGYDYDQHFGGVYYVFLRGVNGESQRGIYSDRPSKALIESLSGILGDFACANR